MPELFEAWRYRNLPDYPAIPIVKPLETKYENFIQPKNPEQFYRKITYSENPQLLDITYFLHTRGAESYYRPKYSICPKKLTYAFIPNLTSLDKIQTFIPLNIQDYIDKAIYKLEHVGIFNSMVLPVMIINLFNSTNMQATNFASNSPINIQIGGVALFTFDNTTYNTTIDDIVQNLLEFLTQCNTDLSQNPSDLQTAELRNTNLSKLSHQMNNQDINTQQTRIIRTMATSFYYIN